MPATAKPRVKPPALKPGDVVGIVAPASDIKRELLEAGCEALRTLGYKPFYFDSILQRDLYFAGSHERRAHELQAMFERDDVRAIICARGGYGSNYLLQALDLRKIASRPKIFVGYSDITTVLTYFADAGGFVTFHGPMVTKDFSHNDGVDLASWQAALGGQSEWKLEVGTKDGVTPVIQGSAEGVLYGGCLSMLVASLGTPYEVQTEGTILFIEDIATKPYQIDRMLMQLKLAGKLADVRGIIFGEMVDCVQKEQAYTLQEVISRLLQHLNVPIAYGLRSGHVSKSNITLPIGIRAAMQVTNEGLTLKMLESTTAPSLRAESVKTL